MGRIPVWVMVAYGLWVLAAIPIGRWIGGAPQLGWRDTGGMQGLMREAFNEASAITGRRKRGAAEPDEPDPETCAFCPADATWRWGSHGLCDQHLQEVHP